MKQYRLSITVISIASLFSVLPGLAWAKEEPVKEVVSQEASTETPEAEPEVALSLEQPKPAPVVRDVAVASREFWDKLAWCETHQDWQNGGKWAGGLGIYSQGKFPESNMGTWERYGGEEFAPSPDKATIEQQLVIAERISIHGWKTTVHRDPERAKIMGVPVTYEWSQRPVGFHGWGALHCATSSPIKSPKRPPVFFYEDLSLVISMKFEMSQEGKEVHDLQGIIGVKQDGKYGPITRAAHLKHLEKSGLDSSGVPPLVKKDVHVASSGGVSSQSVSKKGGLQRCKKWESELRKYGLPVREFSFIMWRESKCEAKAIGWNYREGMSHRDCKISHARTYRKCKAVKSYDVGLLQINSSWKTLTAQVCGRKYGKMLVLQDPECNLKVAKELYEQSGMSPWRGKSKR